jgi:hypothetical protein
MVMNQEEILHALRNGAVLNISDSGEVQIQAPDDLPPGLRECYRASKEHDRDHQRACPDCLDDEAKSVLLDADSHRQDGNEEIALELEAEAAEIRLRAAALRLRQWTDAKNAERPKPLAWGTLRKRVLAPFRSLIRFII